MKRFWIAIPILALIIAMLPVSAFAAQSVTATFGVVVSGPVESKVEIRPGEANIENDATNPMPAGTVDGVYTIEGYADGEESIVSITFTQPGTYTYNVKQIANEGAGGIYDTVEYTVTVGVVRDEDDAGNLTDDLKVAVSITTEGSTSKFERVTFTNSMPAPPPPPPTPTPDDKVYNLTVTEEIYGEAPRTDTFDFTLEFSHPDKELPTSFEVTGSRFPNGGTIRFTAAAAGGSNFSGSSSGTDKITATFTLGHEQDITIKGLPDGTQIKIVQTGGDERYETKIDGTLDPTRTADRAVAGADVKVDYANGYYSDPEPPTPDPPTPDPPTPEPPTPEPPTPEPPAPTPTPNPEEDIPDDPTPLDPGDWEDLPATGLSWWPIPVLVLVGGALIFIGLKARKKTQK